MIHLLFRLVFGPGDFLEHGACYGDSCRDHG